MQSMLSPSILSIDKVDYPKILKTLEENKVEYIHVDIMDGKFVPALTGQVELVELAKKSTNVTLDVHLMIEEPFALLDEYIAAGADIITVHIEAVQDLGKYIEYLHAKNVKVGVSLKPNTSVSSILEFLPKLDLVLIMSVEPGAGGQSFMPESLDKVNSLSAFKKDFDYKYIIEIDGGINGETSKLACDAGAELLVAGSYVFGGEIQERLESLRHEVK